MHLREDEKRLRVAAQGVLAFIGLLLMGAGLALLSGVAHTGQPTATTALLIVRPLQDRVVQDAVQDAGQDAAQEAGQGTAPAAARSAWGDRDEAAVFGPPRATEPPRHEGRPQRGHPQMGHAAVRLAIVIDDLGNNLEWTERFLALGQPLTYSILPAVPATRASAARVRQAHGEYIIHMPMQPFDFPRENPGPEALLLNQGMEATAQRVREYLRELPDAVGASNHMGSAYTYDTDRMQVVQTVLAEHHLFFFNSKTSATPVPERVARQWGYAYLERNVFLDNDPSEAAIEREFQRVVRQAQHAGHAAAIGHPYPQTLRVLQRGLPRLARAGVTLVPLSALLTR